MEHFAIKMQEIYLSIKR